MTDIHAASTRSTQSDTDSAGRMLPRLLVALIAALAFLTVGCGEGNVFSLEIGECFMDPDDLSGEISDVKKVDCSEPHDNEVYLTFDLPDGDYPGPTAVEETAADRCLAAFDAYVGTDYASSALDIAFLTPSEDSWDAGDQEVVCITYDLTGAQLTQSVKGSGL